MKNQRTNKRKLTGSLAVLSLLLCISAVLFLTLPKSGGAFGETETSDFSVVTDADGAFAGINLPDSAGGAFRFEVPAEATATESILGVVTFDLGTVSTDLSTGLLLKLAMPGRTNYNPQVRMLVEDSEGNCYYFAPSASPIDKILIREDGSSAGVRINGFTLSLPAGTAGTLYIPWNEMYRASSGWPAMESGVTVVKLHLAMDMRSSASAAWGRPLTVVTVGTALVSEEAVTVERLIRTGELSYSAVDGDLSKEVNLSDKQSGSRIYVEKGLLGSMTFGGSNADLALSAANFAFTRQDITLGIRCVCENGDLCTDSQHFPGFSSQTIPFDRETGEFRYEITPPSFDGHTYKTADGPLSGSLTEDGLIVLTYEEADRSFEMAVNFCDEEGRVIQEPQTQTFYLDPGSDTAAYEISPPPIYGYNFVRADGELTGILAGPGEITLTYTKYDRFDVITEGDEFVGIRLNESMFGTLQVNVSKDGTPTNQVLGVVTYELGEIRQDEATGLLLQFATLGAYPRQIRPSLEDSEGNLYFFTLPDGTADLTMITKDGMPIGVTANNWSLNLPAETSGTMYIPWSNMCVNDQGWKQPPEGLTFVRLHVAIDMRGNTTASWNLPFILGTVATANVSEEGVLVDKILNTGELTFTEEEGDQTCGVNLTDKISGSRVYSRHGFVGSTMTLGGTEEDVTTAIGNFEFSRYSGITLTVRYVDEEGTPIRTEQAVSLDYEENGASYEVTPADLTGYEFVSADGSLTGTVSEDLTLVLTYRITQFRITLEFVDQNGNKIKEDRYIDADYQSVIQITIDEIPDYIYQSNSMKETHTGQLSLTVVRDMTIRITYAVESGGSSCSSGCGGSAAGSSLAGVLVLLGAVCLRLFRK